MIKYAGLVLLHPESDRVLLLKRADDGRWSVPGGHIENGESPLDAALREFAEETGLMPPEADQVSFLGDNRGFRHFVVASTSMVRPRLGRYDEHTNFAWVRRTDPPHGTYPGLARLLDQI